MNIGFKLFFLKKSYVKKLEPDKPLQSFGLLPNIWLPVAKLVHLDKLSMNTLVNPSIRLWLHIKYMHLVKT